MGLWLPDVSQYQGKINWSSIKTPAIIRTGFGDDIKSQDDLYAQYNLKECARLGIPVATYLYSYADSLTHILSEIEHEKRVTKGYKVLAHILDLEEWRYKDFARQAATRWLAAFPDNGLIYAGQSYWKGPLKGLECKRWIPAYGTNNGKRQDAYKPSFDMVGWQFTSRYHLPGINGNVDMSEWYGFPFTGITPVKITPVRKEILKKEVAAMIMLHMCAHDAHGYTQDMQGRQGTGEETIYIYGVPYKIKGGDRDCSSAVINAYEAAGISCGGATFTGNMRERMVKSGNFAWRSMKFTADMGDTYLNEKCHTAMCLSAEPDVLMEFSINEKGTALGGKVGDQLQKGEYDETYGRGESHLAAYYDYPWNGILQCINDQIAFIIEEDGTISKPNKDDGFTATEEKKVEVTAPTKTDTDLGLEIWADKYGKNEARKKALGSRYNAAQAEAERLNKLHISEYMKELKAYEKKFGALFK